jgi:NAD(P)H:quinone oxidoreductase type IV
MSSKKAKILVVFYSMTGNVGKLARSMARGAEETGAEVRLRQVAELIPRAKWNDETKNAKEELKDIPAASNADLLWADGIAFGSPTRYGNMSAQLKSFIDQTGALWAEGRLVGKVASVFTSAMTQHGGHETTILTSIAPLLHHGMIIIGVPYTEHRLMEHKEITGGGPYGASSVSGANKEPSLNELEIARAQGKRLAEITKKIFA